MRRCIYYCSIVLVVASCSGRLGRENVAQNNMNKGRWVKARALLRKAMTKDSLNVTADYLLGKVFISPQSPFFQIDSSYAYAMKGLHDFALLPLKEKDRLRRFPIDSTELIHLRETVDSAAFARAKAENTEQAYLDFIGHFPFAGQLDQARELRDEAAYLDALKENTWQAYAEFLKKYPQAGRADEAKARYERLIFEDKTKSKKLSDYVTFLTGHPQSPYRDLVEKAIFEITTASGRARDFRQYLNKYPHTRFERKAINILFHLASDSVPARNMNDSLARALKARNGYLVPFLANGRFGFMNSAGQEQVAPTISVIDTSYRCGNITDDLLLMNHTLYSRTGAIMATPVDSAEDLGAGFLLLSASGKQRVMHQSGFIIDAGEVQDCKVVGHFLAIEKTGRWSVWTFTGRQLLPYDYSAIDVAGDGLALTQRGEVHLCHEKDVAATANQVPLEEVTAVDEIKPFGDLYYWVRTGDRVGIMDNHFNYWIPPNPYPVVPAPFGALVRHRVGIQLYNYSGATLSADSAVFRPGWSLVQQEGKWRLLNERSFRVGRYAMDSISFSGPLLIAQHRDSVRIFLSQDQFLQLPSKAIYHFLPGKESEYFIVVENGNERMIYSAQGSKLFAIAADKVEYAGEGFFWVTRKSKMGLADRSGKIVLPLEYDALGSVSNGQVTELRDKQFGYADVVNALSIKPAYQKNLVPYDSVHFIAYKDGNYGLIDWKSKPVIPFDYEDIRYWNDSSALLKKNFQWIIYDFKNNAVLLNRIRNMTWLQNTRSEQVVIARQDNDTGVISSRRGIVVPLSFSVVQNLGSPDVPLYFTDKFVEEASIHVVIYYDHDGNQLKREVFESNDFNKIHCPD